ncbi:MAG: hypothetical protein ACE5LG_00520 [Anaerolineae bacterium]
MGEGSLILISVIVLAALIYSGLLVWISQASGSEEEMLYPQRWEFERWEETPPSREIFS